MARLAGEERRKQIIEAAHTAILDRGLAQAATRDVTRALGVGSGLLHHYFPSWLDLRAQAVQLAVDREISEVQVSTSSLGASESLTYLISWMVEDEDMRHWRLWLNAMDEAHRDPRLAKVMTSAVQRWHEMVKELIARAQKEGICPGDDPAIVAWRLTALMDGLAGMALIEGGSMTLEKARNLLTKQLTLELGADFNNNQAGMNSSL